MIDRFNFAHFNDRWRFDNKDAELIDSDYMEDMRREEEIEHQLEVERLKNKMKIGR